MPMYLMRPAELISVNSEQDLFQCRWPHPPSREVGPLMLHID
jgi:hypothetical protein